VRLHHSAASAPQGAGPLRALQLGGQSRVACWRLVPAQWQQAAQRPGVETRQAARSEQPVAQSEASARLAARQLAQESAAG
jgi:hypothetical protein